MQRRWRHLPTSSASHCPSASSMRRSRTFRCERPQRPVQRAVLSRPSSTSSGLLTQEVRMIIGNGLLQQLMIAPAVVNARASVGMATPYASLLLEAREGEVAFIPLEAFRAGLNPTPAAISGLLRGEPAPLHGPRAAGAPYREDRRGAGRRRPAVRQGNRRLLQCQPARHMRRRTPGSSRRPWRPTRRPQTPSFSGCAADSPLPRRQRRPASRPRISRSEPQTREQFTTVAGARVAGAAFAANEGAVVGPIQSENGWHVVKIDGIQRDGGKTARRGARRNLRQARDGQAQGRDGKYREHGPGRDRRRRQASPKPRRRPSCPSSKLRPSRWTAARRPIPATPFRRNWLRR